jgi:hypothetical protein
VNSKYRSQYFTTVLRKQYPISSVLRRSHCSSSHKLMYPSGFYLPPKEDLDPQFTVSCWVRGLQAIIGGLKLLASSSTRHWFSSSAVHQSGLPSSQAAAATLSPRLRPGRRRKLGQWATSEASASVPDRAAAATGLLLPFFFWCRFRNDISPFLFSFVFLC